MNRGLWQKSIGEARLLLTSLCALLFVFFWVFIWLSSMISLDATLQFMLGAIPPKWERLSGVPFRDVATPEGRIALGYVDPLVLFATAVWAISRGSASISGEIDRGTMELLLAQPVKRVTVLGVHTIVTLTGAALLALSGWLGTWVGLALVNFDPSKGMSGPGGTSDAIISASLFFPAALNLFAMTCFLITLTTLVSAFDRHRWRTVGIMGGFYAVQMFMKIVGRMSDSWHWLSYTTFLTLFEPQPMVTHPEDAWRLSMQFDGSLMGMALVAFLLALGVFHYRDVPAPL